ELLARRFDNHEIGHRSARHVVERLVGDAFLELGFAPSAGYQALRPEQHHDHENEAEDPSFVRRNVEVGSEALVDPPPGAREALAIEVLEEGGSDDYPPDVPHPAEDDHAQD